MYEAAVGKRRSSNPNMYEDFQSILYSSGTLRMNTIRYVTTQYSMMSVSILHYTEPEIK